MGLLDDLTAILLIDPPHGTTAKGRVVYRIADAACLSVVATSPVIGHTEDVKDVNTKFIYVPMMSERETRELLEHQHADRPGVLRDRMVAFQLCGASVRQLSCDVTVPELIAKLECAVTHYDVDRLLAWSLCGVHHIGPDLASLKFMQMIPTHNYTNYVVWPRSAVALEVMLTHILQASSDRWLAALNPAADVGSFGTILAGWLFEAYAHTRASYATLNAKFRTYRIKALFDEQAEDYLHPSLTKTTKAPELLSKHVGDNMLLLPAITGDDATHVYHGTVSGFPGIDAVIQRFGRSGDNCGSLVLQMTLQLEHVIKVYGLAIALRLLQVLPSTLAALLCFRPCVSHGTGYTGFPLQRMRFPRLTALPRWKCNPRAGNGSEPSTTRAALVGSRKRNTLAGRRKRSRPLPQQNLMRKIWPRH